MNVRERFRRFSAYRCSQFARSKKPCETDRPCKWKLPRFHFSRTVFYRFLYSYLVILILTVLLSAITYHQTDRVVTKNCRELKLAMLTQAQSNIDDYLMQIDEISSDLIFNADVNTMLYQSTIPAGSPDIYNVYQLSHSLQQSTISSHYFKGYFYIFFKNSSLIFSHDSTYNGFDYFYQNVLSYDGVDYQTWYESLFQGGFSRHITPARNVTLNGVKTSAITYEYSLPFTNSSDSSLGAVEFVIEQQQLQNLLDKANIQGKGWIGILDENGRIITKDSAHPYYSSALFSRFHEQQGSFYRRIDGQNMMVLYVKSSYNNWTYTAILPTSIILSDTLSIERLAIGIILLTFVLGLLISCLLARFNSKPIQKVASAVREYAGHDRLRENAVHEKFNELDYIEGNIHHIIQDSRMLEDGLKKNVTVLQDIFMDKLIREGFSSDEEMTALMANSGLNIQGEMFEVMSLRIRPAAGQIASAETDADIVRLTLRRSLLEMFGGSSHLSPVSSREYAVLFIFPTGSELENKLKITGAMDRILKQMSAEFHCSALFGIGKTYRHPGEIHTSYAEARRALALCDELGGNESAVWYESLKYTVSGFYYPLDLEIRLLNACKSGNQTNVTQILQKIKSENFEQHDMTPGIRKLLLFNMQCTLMKLAQEVRMPPDFSASFAEARWESDSDSAFSEMGNNFLSVCQMVNGSKKSHNVRLRDNILAYMVANYTHSDLCSDSIARHFNLSASYFSQFFKEQTGETFTSYLENLRIREACLRIEHSDAPVYELTGQLGFNSVYSFRRSFKKVVGLTPLAYKESTEHGETDGHTAPN